MSSIGTLFPTTTSSTSTTSPTSSSSASSSSSSSSSSANSTNSLASQSTFLQLLVAQLQNQDPTQPTDGTQFVTQLATFSNVEQSLGTRQDLDAISQQYLGTSTPPSEQATSASSTSSTLGSDLSSIQ